MHDTEKYLESLYCMQDKIKEEAEAFAQSGQLDPKGIQFFDTLMHAAKNLRKEIMGEEGYYDMPDEEYMTSGGTQGFGRAIRTTPGMDNGMTWDGGNGSSYRGEGGGSNRSMRSMRGGSMRGRSGRRDSRGRFAASGEDPIEKLRRKADMTGDHDERERILDMIDWLEQEEQ